MRRKSIVFSLPSLILVAILFSTLGLDIFQHGGRAFSPGNLTGSSNSSLAAVEFDAHVEFENECGRCHQPLRTRQAELCMECHVDVAGQIESSTGSHGMIESVFACYECHSDHKGKDFDPTVEAMVKFDHSITPFSLRWHQVEYDTLPMQCDTCHVTTPEFTLITGSCEQCHASHQPEFMEQHLLDFGEKCTDCHDGIDRMADFDHQNTKFPLDGNHLEVQCAECHHKPDFESPPLDCSGCHLEPEVHINQFDPDCSTCHNSQSWKPAFFDGQPFEHEDATGFSLILHRLDYSGNVLACRDCHSQTGYEVNQDVCVVCHTSEAPEFMQNHLNQFGTNCLDCHDGVDRLSDFDHAARFPLSGRHSEIECESCHIDKVFLGTPTECVQCHAEPEIHAGFFGLNCEYCHTEDAWTPAEMRMHTFPLDHGEGEDLDCQVCHVQVYQEYTCYGCHEHQPDEIAKEHQEENIDPLELANCSSCHPTGEEAKDD